MTRIQGMVLFLNSIPALILTLMFAFPLHAWLISIGIPASPGLSAAAPMMITLSVMIPGVVFAFVGDVEY